MRIEVLASAESVAREAAAIIAEKARSRVTEVNRFVMAVSGGRTPLRMFRALATEMMPWERVHVVQVDERVAPAGHPDRNFTHLRENLIKYVPLNEDQIHAMPVESSDLEAAATRYSQTLHDIAGSPPILDLVQLGLGSDGHTASLVPGDPVIDVFDADVAMSGVYDGRRRMTLTFPAIDRSRFILWLVTGSEKWEMLLRLRRGDISIPAARVRRDQAIVLADLDAGRELGPI
jgi:6-phosphogluconolactonase